MADRHQPELKDGLEDPVDRCHLEVLRLLAYLDVTEPIDRACVLAALVVRLERLRDEQAELAIEVGEWGTQAALARAMAVSPQAVHRRFRENGDGNG